MNAYEIVAEWSHEQVVLLRRRAKQARAAYNKPPFAAACARYADALEEAASIMADAGADLRQRAVQGVGRTETPQGRPGP